MAREKLGVAIFAGLLGATALISSGQFFDANKLLEDWQGKPAEATQDASTNTNEPAVSAKVPGEEKAPTEETISEVEKAPTKPPKESIGDDVAKTGDQPAEMQSETTPKAEVDSTQSDEAAPQVDAAQAQSIVPTFDILRVEPDGSTLIAGLAAPNAQVELSAGSKTLTKTTANERGEFVAVLDEPLEKGDYEIVLRATAPDGEVLTSAETAIVSIPEKGSDQVLALVEAPGVPSRLITKPDAGSVLVPVEESEKPDDAVTETETEQPEADAPEAQTEIAETKPDSAEEIESEKVETETSVVETETAKADTAKKPEMPVRIEAVEIDGPSVFVAGGAEPGATIRLYANDILLGDTVANEQGRFLVDVKRDLPVGDYVIRADSLAPNGLDVLMRAAVPFTRSEGEKLAAVAVPAAPALPDNAPDIPVKDTQKETNSAPEQPAEKPTETEVAEQTVAEQPTARKPETTLAEKLQPARDSVIIRRGDTLWHISRRVYGRGIKYTTIYDANQAQIKDPDMIWPGQVFDLPEPGEAQNN